MTCKTRAGYMRHADKESRRTAREEYKNLKKRCSDLKSESEILRTNIESNILFGNDDESLKKCINHYIMPSLDRAVDIGEKYDIFTDNCIHLLLNPGQSGCDKEDCPNKEANTEYCKKLEEYRETCKEKESYWRNRINAMEK